MCSSTHINQNRRICVCVSGSHQMEDFEIGNVVQLRSVGPKMTVHDLVSDSDVVEARC